MKAFEIIQLLTKELIPIERCGTAKFETSNLSELSQLFERHYTWSGHMFKGNVFYVYNNINDNWTIQNADIMGIAIEDNDDNVYVFQVREE